MSKANDREREISAGICWRSVSMADDMAEVLAEYREELLRPFEELCSQVLRERYRFLTLTEVVDLVAKLRGEP